MNPNEDFHEVWWIWADPKHDYGGLRIAHFRKTKNDALIFFITSEPPERAGPRIWDEVSKREGWHKVREITVPTRAMVMATKP